MMTMRATTHPSGLRRAARVPLALAALAAATAAAGCSTATAADRRRRLAEAQTFPYYGCTGRVRTFDQGYPLAAADGRRATTQVGDSVYYGDCVHGKGIFGGGSCLLPLQVTTVIYRLHSNTTLGPQRNIVVRGVPATVYDEGRSIELYTGRVAIDIFSDSSASHPRRRGAAAGERAGLGRGQPASADLLPRALRGGGRAAQTLLQRLPRAACHAQAPHCLTPKACHEAFGSSTPKPRPGTRARRPIPGAPARRAFRSRGAG